MMPVPLLLAACTASPVSAPAPDDPSDPHWEKHKGDALSKRFEEAVKEAKKTPVSKPLRGFDLD